MIVPGAPSVSQRFNEAKNRYEEVVKTKGSWYDNWSDPSVYQDEKAQESLMIAQLLLMGTDDDLRQMPKPNDWLLHRAGVFWQQGLISLLNGDFDRAARENGAMREVIPRVPDRLWGHNQRAQYESNAEFLDGEIALGRGERDTAAGCFKKSLAIDLATGDRSGIERCKRYLSALGYGLLGRDI